MLADLTSGAVRQAVLSISAQVEVSGTGALVSPTRREQTQVTAAAVIRLTRVTPHYRTTGART